MMKVESAAWLFVEVMMAVVCWVGLGCWFVYGSVVVVVVFVYGSVVVVVVFVAMKYCVGNLTIRDWEIIFFNLESM